ncbi:MAG: class I SAM-dependent methyltransferase [Nitrospirota bacterium]
MAVDVETLCHREQSVLFYEERFSRGYMDEWPLERKQRLIDLLKELSLPECGRGLDFGCGNGVLTAVLKEVLPKWTIEGTDVSETAVHQASIRCPQCRFFVSINDDVVVEPYDFVFTHHVMEHVYDLDRVWAALVRLLKPRAGMLHILPCGNEGSFESQLCKLREGGINRERGNRFFFEDEGHLRRLSTNDLEERATRHGFVLQNEYYANQWYGAVDWITAGSLQFVREISDTSLALDRPSKRRLSKLRRILLTFGWARFLIAEYNRFQAKRPKRLKHHAFLIGSIPAYLVARWADRFLMRKVRQEWMTQRGRRDGSEMYLYFTRG